MTANLLGKLWHSLRPKRPYIIRPYRGYGAENRFFNMGRALVDKRIQFRAGQSFLETVRNTYRLFQSDEIRFEAVKLKLPDGTSFDTKTDAEGYYKFQMEHTGLRKHIDEEGWLPFTVSFSNQELDEKRIASDNGFKGEIMIPPPEAEYGVISDIDDTILHTGVTSLLKWRLILNSLFRNIDRRLPVLGMAERFQDYHLNEQGKAVNPIFYVSNSPWNLYIYLKGFLELNEFPKGPILLRDIRTPYDKTPKPKVEHKVRQIHNILNTYPKLQFILVGDNGQKDPIIYEQITRDFPGRIKDIFIRKVK